jgi:hypothetical protein
VRAKIPSVIYIILTFSRLSIKTPANGWTANPKTVEYPIKTDMARALPVISRINSPVQKLYNTPAMVDAIFPARLNLKFLFMMTPDLLNTLQQLYQVTQKNGTETCKFLFLNISVIL